MNHPSLYLMGSATAKIFKNFPLPQQKHLAMFSQGAMRARHCHHSRIAAAVPGDVDPETRERQLRRAIDNERLDPAKFTACWAAYVFKALPEMEAICMATRNNAKILRWDDEIGTVDAGKYADLLLLNSDPLADIRNLRDIAAVYKGGAKV